MRTCSICGKQTEQYIKLKDDKRLCKRCFSRLPDSLKEKINEIPFHVIEDLIRDYIRPLPRQDVKSIDAYGSLFLDETNGRLFISNAWIRTAGIESYSFHFFPIEETKDTVTVRVALEIKLRILPVYISDEVDTATINKEQFLSDIFPWAAFSVALGARIAETEKDFVYHRSTYQNKKTEQKTEQNKKEQQRQRTNQQRRTVDPYRDALAFFKLSENYTMQELRSARNKAQRAVHPDNNGGSKDFARMEELSKLANQYYDILKKRLKN